MPANKSKVPSEHTEQKHLLTWASLNIGKHPDLRLLFAIPNGGARSKACAGKLKAEGVKPGIPDLCLPVARGGFFGLYLELKRIAGSTTSPAQKQWHRDLLQEGYHVVTAKGMTEAQQVLVTYLTLASTARSDVALLLCPPTPPPAKAKAPRKNPRPTIRWATDTVQP